MAIVGASIVLGMPAQSFAHSMVAGESSGLPARAADASTPTTDESGGVVNTGALNIRSGPGIGYEVVTIAYQGTAITLVGRHPNNNWVLVRLNNGIEGWVNSSYISSRVPYSTLRIVEDSHLPEPVSPETSTTVVATGALNLRSSPTLTNNIKAVLRRGDTVITLGRNEDGSWLLVRSIKNVEGWVNASYLHIGLPVMALPLVPQVAAQVTEEIVSGAVNVRSGPGSLYDSLSVLQQGQHATLLGRSSDGQWIQIRTENGELGWVSASAFQENVDFMGLLVVEASEEAKTAAVVTGALNVRYGPGTNFGIFTIIYKGDMVMMLGRALYSNWVQIELSGGNHGWVNSRYLSSDQSIDLLPVAWP